MGTISCSTPVIYRQELLSGGKIWRVHISDVDCTEVEKEQRGRRRGAPENAGSSSVCKQRLLAKASEWGEELCGFKAPRVFACGLGGTLDRAFTTCYVSCENQTLKQTKTSQGKLSSTYVGKVIDVIDGDTIDILSEGRTVRIRLSGIDCPEPDQAFGTKAKKFTSELVLEKTVTVKNAGTDKYGRPLGEVLLKDGSNLNRQLIKNGLAWWYK